MLEKRSTENEIMDDLGISGEVVDQTLRELDLINRKLGGNKISTSAFKRLLKEKTIRSVADLGCGGADILIAMATIAKSRGHQVAFTGVDANPSIVGYAQNHVKEWGNIGIRCLNIFSPEFRALKFDIIHCCLFTHHFTSPDLVRLLIAFKEQAEVAIIINDLHRHWIAYHSIRLITRFFSRSYMVRNDAAVSVARGFHRKELQKILQDAGIRNFTLRWKWAFRWKLIIHCQ